MQYVMPDVFLRNGFLDVLIFYPKFLRLKKNRCYVYGIVLCGRCTSDKLPNGESFEIIKICERFGDVRKICTCFLQEAIKIMTQVFNFIKL